jgi:hypothetical protein
MRNCGWLTCDALSELVRLAFIRFGVGSNDQTYKTSPPFWMLSRGWRPLISALARKEHGLRWHQSRRQGVVPLYSLYSGMRLTHILTIIYGTRSHDSLTAFINKYQHLLMCLLALNLLSLGNCENVLYCGRPGLCWSRDTGTISSAGYPFYSYDVSLLCVESKHIAPMWEMRNWHFD